MGDVSHSYLVMAIIKEQMCTKTYDFSEPKAQSYSERELYKYEEEMANFTEHVMLVTWHSSEPVS